MSMFGMLACSKNYKNGYGGNICRECEMLDDENHRINDCSKFKGFNLFYSPVKYEFDSIFSNDEDVVSRTVEVVMLIWNLEN